MLLTGVFWHEHIRGIVPSTRGIVLAEMFSHFCVQREAMTLEMKRDGYLRVNIAVENFSLFYPYTTENDFK